MHSLQSLSFCIYISGENLYTLYKLSIFFSFQYTEPSDIEIK